MEGNRNARSRFHKAGVRPRGLACSPCGCRSGESLA
jgi:hypothetical protein